ncbi:MULTISPECIES: class I SAM-dependent methyltransferase [unclassified Bradyrhizobium]|uniref:class I SAM-dependent methyltransferase n=1 Tax=unclassified Bradyrhizobium TaxID=2631580 RepID=UPI00188C109F|nr:MULTISPECIES: class I SAM-dependent methyltransferase [unclassified Bradyrhizobium]MDN4985196.1 class I SAM-dependent methyltransferase [Bradyrhizobium sp. WYCCWR 13022]QOZ51356.1 class I SAM-dependent methyltransferase [Bradyrhizobium sp. CCBAU 53338]
MKQDPYPTAANPIHQAVVKLFYSRAARHLFTNAWYSLLSSLDQDAAIRFLNYGYASLNGEQVALQAVDEPDRYAIQLYHHTVSGAAIEGKDVLEVGCGRGGGASYIARYLHPRSYTGLDICKPAIRFNKARYADQDNLAFQVGNALSLPFADERFDVVVNVESAQHYGDMGRFLDEVHRVLRPGGVFLMACFEDRSKDVYPRESLAKSRLRLTCEDDITANVARALELDGARRTALADEIVPRVLLGVSHEFAGIPGTQLHASFADGTCPYYCFTCRKD